jgi:hypothetical protein
MALACKPLFFTFILSEAEKFVCEFLLGLLSYAFGNLPTAPFLLHFNNPETFCP